MNRQKIFWFQDGVKLRSQQNIWDTIDSLNKQLISLVDNPYFEQEIVNPIFCMDNLFNQLDLTTFSSIVDLSGFFGENLRQLAPNSSVMDNFRLSRVRVVTSPKLDCIGFLVSQPTDEVKRLKDNFDLSHPLLIDDVSWSGRTIVEAAKLLEINLNNTTCGLLAVNNGDFGEGKPGASKSLEQQGVRVISGFTVQTPKDDGFHLVDFFNFDFIGDPNFFDILISIQELREQTVNADEQQKKRLEAEVRDILNINRERFFPNATSTEDMKQLQEEGRLIVRAGINKNSFFDTNPPNWLMPSFSRRVTSQTLKDHSDEIINTLRGLRDIIKPGEEEKRELLEESRIRQFSPRGVERF